MSGNRKSRSNNNTLLALLNCVAITSALLSTYCFMFGSISVTQTPQQQKEEQLQYHNPFENLFRGDRESKNNNNNKNNTEAYLDIIYDDDSNDYEKEEDEEDPIDRIELFGDYDEDDDGFLTEGNETRTLASFWDSFRATTANLKTNTKTKANALRKTAAPPP